MAASDAAEDTPGQGTGGFLLEVREAFEAIVTPELYRMFTPGTHKIAQLELSMVFWPSKSNWADAISRLGRDEPW